MKILLKMNQKFSELQFAYLVHLEQILSLVHRLHKQEPTGRTGGHEEQFFSYRLSDYYNFPSLSVCKNNKNKGLRIYLAKDHLVVVGPALQKKLKPT